MADDYLGKFAKDHEMSEDEAEAFAQDFLAKTKAEDFPADADIAQQLEFHYWRTQGGTLQQQVEAAKKAGYEAALAKIRAGQGAELGSPAQRSEVPWTPPKDANTRPMDASFKAAMEDEEIRFDDVSLT
jgi:polyhydroxyalkanoate synthesis regulator phasin